MRIDFTVAGVPQPQGSAKAFIPRGWKRAIITSDNAKLKPWRQEIAAMARSAMVRGSMAAGGFEIPTEQAVEVACYFYFQKPKSASRKVTRKITKPDIDKLLRGVLDALTGIVFRDDAQVVGVQCYKLFDEAPSCRIIVEECVDERPALETLARALKYTPPKPQITIAYDP